MLCTHDSKKIIYEFDATSIWQCADCAIIFSEKCQEAFDSKTLYNAYYYKNEIAGRFSRSIELVVKAFRFFRAFKIFTISPSARSILDIGSGRGFMLYYLKKFYRYSRAAGTQIARGAFEFSRDELGLEMYDKDLLELDFPDASFDMVTLWHVFEHIKEPERYLEKIRNILTKKGKLVIEVPNFGSWTRKLTGRYWLGLDIDYHIHFFTPAGLCMLLKKYGFKVKMVHTFSLEYSTFISAQSIVSLLTRSDQFFFRYLQVEKDMKMNLQAFGHMLLFLAISPWCFIVNILLFFSKKGEVLLVIAEK
jgi:SAM-dependent methyltransferase